MTNEELIEKNAILAAENQLQKVDELPFNTQLKVAAKLLGYKKMPPDIETFIKDPYYLGSMASNLYPFWVDELKEIFPTPIHTRYPIIVVTGGIGTGKSTFSRIVAAYNLCRLDHLINPHKTMGMIVGKKIVFNFLMPTRGSAETEFVGTLNEWFQSSPYFRDGMINGMDQYELTAEGLIGKGQIGRDVIFYVMSELNFLPYDKAMSKLDTALNRWDSRFGRFTDYFGGLIIDTSSAKDDSIADEFIKSNPYGDKVLPIFTNQWKVREHLNFYGRKGWFKVYSGDSTHAPFIISKNNPLSDIHDPDRVIDVPEELRPDFEFSLEKALQDKAGISTSMTDKFIQNPESVMGCFSIPTTYQDELEVDFFDKGDKLIYQLSEAIRTIPTDKILFIHYDIGVTGDRTGLSIAYFDKWQDYGVDSANKRMRLPRIIVPVAVAIGRKQEQETSIFKLQEFIIDLSDRYELYFSADAFCSRQLFQNLTMVDIKNNYISVDRTDAPYIYLKTLLTNGLIQLPRNKILINEISNLRRVGRKIDHPSNGCFLGSTKVLVSPKMSDEVVEIALDELVNNYDQYRALSYSEGDTIRTDIVKVWCTKSVTELIKLEFESGTYYCTPDHRILTTRGYTRAMDLTEDMDIISINHEC